MPRERDVSYIVLCYLSALSCHARLKRQLESARGIIKVVAKGEGGSSNSNKRLRLGDAGGRDSEPNAEKTPPLAR